MARRFKHSQYPKIFKPLYPNNLTLSLKKQHVIMNAILFERVFMESVLNFLTNINVIFTLLGYLIGGIPFGYALMKIFYGMDITKIGSGGIGATNVLRALQSKGVSNAKQMALLVLILDLLKGMFAVSLSKLFGLDYSLQWMVAIASILGHCYSPFLNFNGGKGVSTTMGSVALLIPIESLIGLVVWFFVGKVLKISSLASILGVSTAAVLVFFVPYMHIPDSVNILKEVGTQTPMVLIFIFTLIKHAGNIFNLLAGKEKKIL